LVAPDVMRKLTYTATPVGADQALVWGLVTKLADDPLAAAMELAAEIAGRSPAAIRAAKRLMVLAETATDADILLAESQEQAVLIGKPEQMEVVAATLGKRPAVFQ
jgi:enoyl-CoA hydratase/carnithine racemase